MLLFVSIFFAAGLVMVAFLSWGRLEGGRMSAGERRLFRRWTVTGVAVPCLLWFLLNSGLIGTPVWPLVTPWSSGFGAWWKSAAVPLGAGVLFIATYWCGITAVWLLGRAGQRTEDRRAFLTACGSWLLLIVPGMALLLLFGGWNAVGLALMLFGFGLFHATCGLGGKLDLPPSYARAQARLSFGNYEEAELEVIRELERNENDFNGWLLLAELYATRFNDLAGANQALRDICNEPSTTPVQFSIAMHKLADWHLKVGHDPLAAREALERISARLPGTHLDRMARQRIDQLPGTREELLLRERGRALRLPSLPDLPVRPALRLSRAAAREAAAECVAALEHDPDDAPAREKLARLLAECLGEAGAGIEQLELLLASGSHPAPQRAEWLMTVAGWHAARQNDPDAARLVYQQVIRDFPALPQAGEAQRRLNLLNLQSRFRRRGADHLPG